MPIKITKSSGESVPFQAEKVRQSVLRAGADAATADQILSAVEKAIHPNSTTADIYTVVREQLAQHQPGVAARYNLRRGILRLGPAGFNFEKYVAAVLAAYGYQTATPDTFQGACIEHEIDVTAAKDGRTAFIEAKFRRDFNDQITIKDTMSTWARYLDLVDGGRLGLCPHFDEAWIVTNARFTDQSLRYGHCKNMVMIGWNHPRERSFAQMVDVVALYPLTVIEEVDARELEAFSRANLMLCREIERLDADTLARRTGLAKTRCAAIQKLCDQVVR